jgi:hypothetical protein
MHGRVRGRCETRPCEEVTIHTHNSPWPRQWPTTSHRAICARLGVGLPQNRRQKHARPPIVWPARRGTSACSAFRVRPAQPSPALGDAINAGFRYLEVKCLGCNTHQTVALDIVRRPKATPIHELERYMRCKDCSRLQGRPYKRSHLVAPRATKIAASDPPSTWWPGER